MNRLAATLIGAAMISASPIAAQVASQAAAKPAAATNDSAHPPAVTVRRTGDGYVYVTPQGLTVYYVNVREARAHRGSVLEYCILECAENFTPLAAAETDQPIGLWKPEKTSRGFQWTYRGSPIFTFNADRPGTTAGDEFIGMFGTVEYIPPQPRQLAAPAGVRYNKGEWLMADAQGRFLFTRDSADACAAPCPTPQPFLAALAARPVGDWRIIDNGNELQWAYKNQPVFVTADPGKVPDDKGAKVIAIAATITAAK